MKVALTTGFVATTMGDRGYEVVPGTDRPITGGSPDSRTVRPGDLFAAFRGENRDGNDFVRDATAAGAVAVVCERLPEHLPEDVTAVISPDTRVAMKEVASAWRDTCGARVVGITGTVGKTTAKEAVATLLESRFAVHRSPGNMNSREGLPLALLTLHPDHEISVLEMAMDSPGEILELCEVARPDVGVLLNIGLTHVSKLGSIGAIEKEKLSLVRYLSPDGTAILNVEDARVAGVAGTLACREIGFGPDPATADLVWSNVDDCGLDGVRFDVSLRGEDPIPARSPLIGVHTLPAALAALAAGLAFDFELGDAAAALNAGEVTGRMKSLPGPAGSTVLDDTYNSSPASLAGALRTLDAVRGEGPGRRLALLGPMAELGAFESEEHRAAGRLAARHCDRLVAIGEPCRELVEEARAAGLADAHWYDTREEAALAIAKNLQRGDVVLVKASRTTALETVVPTLTGEGAG